MDYIYGNPDNAFSWKNVASIFAAHDSLNSAQTSSLPLVQFWRPSGEKSEGKKMSKQAIVLLKKCFQKCYNEAEFKRAQLCFEYSVPVYKGSGIGKASMTDLMIITAEKAIAVEAKWKECDERYPTIDEWFKDRLRKGAKQENLVRVLNGWIKYINEYLDVKKLSSEKKLCKMAVEGPAGRVDDGDYTIIPDHYKTIPYQLLHRIASACAVANKCNTDANKRNTDAIVIYQLFYNENNGDLKEITEKKVQTFANKLNEGYAKLFGKEKPIQFCIMKTKVTKGEDFDAAIEQCKKGDDLNELFLAMQHQNIYSF